MVRGIQRYHRNVNGWDDIGYNFRVDRYGQVFEGRAGGAHLAVVGAHAQGYNGVSTGIATLGTFGAAPASSKAISALARLIAWKMKLHGTPVQGKVAVVSTGGSSNRYPRGTAVTLDRVSGHRDGDSTSLSWGSAVLAATPPASPGGSLFCLTARVDGGGSLGAPMSSTRDLSPVKPPPFAWASREHSGPGH